MRRACALDGVHIGSRNSAKPLGPKQGGTTSNLLHESLPDAKLLRRCPHHVPLSCRPRQPQLPPDGGHALQHVPEPAHAGNPVVPRFCRTPEQSAASLLIICSIHTHTMPYFPALQTTQSLLQGTRARCAI